MNILVNFVCCLDQDLWEKSLHEHGRMAFGNPFREVVQRKHDLVMKIFNSKLH